MNTMYLLNCDALSYYNGESVEIRCNFYESIVYKSSVGRKIQYCACVKQISYLEKKQCNCIWQCSNGQLSCDLY